MPLKMIASDPEFPAQFGQCVRTGKERCEWRSTRKFKRCMSKPA